MCHPSSAGSAAGSSGKKKTRLPAFLRGRSDFALQEVCFSRDAAEDPLGLGLETMGQGTAAESIVLDQMVVGSVVAASGVAQVGSLVQCVRGKTLVGRAGTAEPASFERLVRGIQARADVRLTLVRPTSLACLLTMVSALKQDEIDTMLRRADVRRPAGRRLPGGGAAGALSAASGSEHHALLRMFALPGLDAVDLSGWARRPVTLTRGPHGLGLGIVHLGQGTTMVDACLEGRPAAAARNIQVGSVIAAIDGRDARAMDFDEVQAALGGAAGTSVAITTLQPLSLGALLSCFLTLQRMLIDDGCVEDYEWWQEPDASDEDHDTWSERDGDGEEEEEEDAEDADADDEDGLSSGSEDFDLAADFGGAAARARPPPLAAAATAAAAAAAGAGAAAARGSRSRRSPSPSRSEAEDGGGSQSDNPFEIVIEA